MSDSSRIIPPGGSFKDNDFDFEARIALGAVAAGVGDVGLVFATLDRVTDGDPQSWFDAWTATATTLAAQGDAAAAAGRAICSGRMPAAPPGRPWRRRTAATAHYPR